MDAEQNTAEHIQQITCTSQESTETVQQPKGKTIFNQCRPFFGIILTILSALSVVLMNLFAKLCLVLPPMEIGIIRFVLQLTLTIPPAVHLNTRMIYSKKITALLVLRGVSGTCAMLTRFYAVQNMPLGDATVLMFTSPIFVAIFARIFLKERLHFIYLILIALCLAGVVMIARPTFLFGHPDTVPEYDNILVPSLVAVSAAVFLSISTVIIRVLVGTHKVHSNVIVFYFGITGLIVSIIGSYIDRGFQFPFCQSLEYVYALCVAVFAHCTQYLINGALKYCKAFVVSISTTSGIVFGFMFQVLIFSHIPSGLSFGGAALIISCNIVIFLVNWMHYRKDVQNLNQIQLSARPKTS